MRRSLFVIALAAACGAKQKKPADVPPLPEPQAAGEHEAGAKPAPSPAPAEPAGPPVPEGPIEITLPASTPTVKLVSPGRGKRALLRLTPKVGAKQQVEVALDFKGGQDGPPEAGGKQEQIAPTVLLAADIETRQVGADGGAEFQITIAGVDARDMAGAKASGAEFKAELASLAGATIAGKVGPNGAPSHLTLRIEKPDAKSQGAMELIKVALLPLWPVLPAEAVAPGAKWTVTSKQKIADQLEVTKETSYELVDKKGPAWTIKGTAKLSGADQTMQGATIGSIGGGGISESTVIDGALVPATRQNLVTDFTITLGDPAQPTTVKFHLEQANALTPKT